MSTPVASHVDTRPYLLERVDDAAVVQLYADGYDELPIDQRNLAENLLLLQVQFLKQALGVTPTRAH